MKMFKIPINHQKIYYISLLLVAASLPLSKFAISVSMIILAVNWVVEGQFTEKKRKLRDNPSILIFCGVFLVHLLWLLNTSNFQYALLDLKNKLILIVFPLIIGTSSALKQAQLKFLLLLFSLSVLVSTWISTSVLWGFIEYPITDIREISMFMSHIRLSLLINVSIFSLAYFLFSKKINKSRLEMIAYSFAILWFVFFLFLLKSLYGILIFIFLFLLLAGYY